MPRAELDSVSERAGQAAAQRGVAAADEDAVLEILAVVDAAATDDRVFLERAQAGHSLAGVEDAGFGARNGPDVFAGDSGDAAHALQEVEHDALGREQGGCIAADDGDGLPALDLDAIKNFRVVDDLEAPTCGCTGLRALRVEDVEQGADRAQAGQDAGLARADGRGTAQFRVDRHGCGDVACCLVFDQCSFKNRTDAPAFPIHGAFSPTRPSS